MNSAWRKLHYLLACIAGLFILLASVTGLVLAIEPWVQSRYAVSGEFRPDQTFTSFRQKLNEQFLEVFSLEKDAYGNIRVEGIGLENEGTFYVSAATAEVVPAPGEVSAVFTFSRDLHRSLFLKTPGRLLVGLASLAMVFLAISGAALLWKRAGGIRGLLKSIPLLDLARDGHALLGRLFLLPVLLLSVTGVYLSADRFAELRSADPSENKLQNTNLSLADLLMKDVKKVTFPVMEEEPLLIETSAGLLTIDASSGETKGMLPADIKQKAFSWSFFLHTAEGSVPWAGVLGVSALALLVLTYTGFKLIIDKVRVKSQSAGVLEDLIILVGSETGHTWRFAHALKKAFEQSGEFCTVLDMDKLPPLSGEKTLLLLTSTYGDGDAPENARYFTDRLPELLAKSSIRFGLLGFGSTEYPAFCSFAASLRDELTKQPQALEVVPYMTVDNRSASQFIDWVRAVNKSLHYNIHVDLADIKPKRRKSLTRFEILEKREQGSLFLLRLAGPKHLKVVSGDLLGVYPPGENLERYYSIAVDTESHEIILMIKRTGTCSTYLGNLSIGDFFEGYIKVNSHFHKPASEDLLLVANGTGLAPFLGMADTNSLIFWGSRYGSDARLFEYVLPAAEWHTVYSREENPGYVQDLLLREHKQVAHILKSGGTVMICGSLVMMGGVLGVLDQIAQSYDLPDRAELKRRGQILTDCY